MFHDIGVPDIRQQVFIEDRLPLVNLVAEVSRWILMILVLQTR